MTPDDVADIGERPELPIPLPDLRGGEAVRRSLIVVDHLRRPGDHLAVVAMGGGAAYLVTSCSPQDTAMALRAIADDIDHDGAWSP